ncbi:amino acid adenylation domain-containing protein [Burkholderia sp. FERM BP-3421]|uniref:non-ribosomal peptide synthetase n=1 Tax=Burkholderia sp. FERM BP-3421 TaxID=1494466 RepID=UPI003FCD3439
MSVSDQLEGLSPQRRALLLKLLRQRGVGAELDEVPLRRRGGEAGRWEASWGQQRLWFLDRLEPGSAFYNISVTVHLHGELDSGSLREGLQRLQDRHEILRTVLIGGEQDESGVWQDVLARDAQPLPWTFEDWRSRGEAAAGQRWRELAGQESGRGFDLAKGPLWRTCVIQCDDAHAVLIMTLHHAIADGWSMSVLVDELAAHYEAARAGRDSGLPALPVQYADYAQWQREWLSGARLEQQLSYWREQLRGSSGVLELPTDYARPSVQRYRGAVHSFELDGTVLADVKRMASESQSSVFMVLLSAFYVLLWRYSGQSDLNVGTPVANRREQSLEGLIGFFVNTLVLRCEVGDDPSFDTLLARVRELTLEAQQHQDLPFERLVQELKPERDLGRAPLFQVEFILQNTPKAEFRLPGLRISSAANESHTSKFDLTFEFTERESRLDGVIRYSTDCFAPSTAERLARGYSHLLGQLSEKLKQPISRLTVLSPADRQIVVHGFNATARDVGGTRLLHRRFESQAASTPSATAVRFEGASLSYEELNQRANRLAVRLRGLGAGPDRLVALCCERSLDMMVGLIAILKSGAAYLPLDPHGPPARMRSTLVEAAPMAMLTLARHRGALDAIDLPIIELDAEPDDAEMSPADGNAPWPCRPGNLAYVIYTSGSTGRPKGAMLTHEGICNRLQWMQDEYRLQADDVVLQKTPLTFDVSVWELFWPLLTGACLEIAPPDSHRDPGLLVDLVRRAGVTTLHFVPSMLQSFLDQPHAPQCTSLRRIVCSGEALKAATRDRCFERLTCALHNLYGPTEASVDVSHWQCRLDERGTVPIGRPIANTELYILDPSGEPAPIGASGELFIGGLGVGRGYLARPDLTAASFVPDALSGRLGARLYRTGDLARWREDGSIEFLGRRDFQVKIRGFRIECGDIEAALMRHPEVTDAAVVACGDDARRALNAFVVPRLEQADAAGDTARTRAWEQVFDQTYAEPSAEERAFNVVGWNSSYTGDALPDIEMRAWVDATVDSIKALRPRRILEVGVGTGLLMFPLLASCERYEGWDISGTSIRYLRETLPQFGEMADKVRLEQRGTDAMPQLADGSFDCIVLNSVVQYLSSAAQLEQVMDAAVRALAPGGTLFVGDVRHLGLLDVFHASVAWHQAAPDLTAAEINRRAIEAVTHETELALDPRFFLDWSRSAQRVSAVEIRPKLGGYVNELSRFRYDVVMHVECAAREIEPEWIDWSTVQADASEVCAMLREDRPQVLAFRSIANRRSADDCRLAGLLQRMPTASRDRVEDALAKLSRSLDQDPDAWAALADAAQYWVYLDGLGADGAFDALLIRREDGETHRPVIRWPGVHRAMIARRSSNTPAFGHRARMLAGELKHALAQELPAYMQPSVIVALPALPLNANGKVDRGRLQDLGGQAWKAGGEDRQPLRGRHQHAVAQIWSEVLGRAEIGATDDFFELGGHSLLATQVLARLRERLGVEMALKTLFEHSRLDALAECVAGAAGRADAPALRRRAGGGPLGGVVGPAAVVVPGPAGAGQRVLQHQRDGAPAWRNGQRVAAGRVAAAAGPARDPADRADRRRTG